jgi:predicted RNA-binding Zn ribbon-like protein
VTTHTLPELRVVAHRFVPEQLCAGHVALDFINTAAGLNRDPRDWLDSYDGLLAWARAAGLLDKAFLGDLAARNHSHPKEGRAALERVRRLRAALYTLFHHRRDATRPPIAAVAMLQQWCRRAGASIALQPKYDGILVRSLASCGLDAIAASIALQAADLLSWRGPGALSVCGGHNCGWIFLDTSPTRRRRWCNMKTCGNAAKASRHYRRSRAKPDSIIS